MSVVNLVTLLVNVARVAHGAWGMGDVGAPVLVAVGVQVMDMVAGATVHMGKYLLGTAAYHLVVVATIAGRLHIVMLVVIHLMLMEIKVGPELRKSGLISRGKLCTTVILLVSVSKRDLCYVRFMTMGSLELMVLRGFHSAKCFSHQNGCLVHHSVMACCKQHMKLGSPFLASHYLLLFFCCLFMLTWLLW